MKDSKQEKFTSQQLNIIRGLLLSGKGRLHGQGFIGSKKDPRESYYRFYIEDLLEKLDFIQFCYEKIKIQGGGSWVNLRPRLLKKKRKKTTSLNTFSPSSFFTHNQELQSFQKNLDYEYPFYFEEDKLYFNSFSSQELFEINREFQKEKNKVKRGQSLPSNLSELLNKEVLSFWFLGGGYFKQDKFFLNLGRQSNNEKTFIINTLNNKFNFKIALLSNIKDIAGQEIYLHPAINPFFSKNPKNFYPENQAIVYSGNSAFFFLIKDVFFDLKDQELLFPIKIHEKEGSQSSPFFEFAHEYNKDYLPFNENNYQDLLKERGDNFEVKYSHYSFHDLNQAGLRKAQLIHSYYSPRFLI